MEILFDEPDPRKDLSNQQEHGVSFRDAQQAFADPYRLILEDIGHSSDTELRYKCVGKVHGKVCTVRFTMRNEKIRIFGAGNWRKERRIYEKQNANR